MPDPYIVVKYVFPSDSGDMQTPGELLLAQLERQGVTRADLAKRLRTQWPTVANWCKDTGFSYANRVRVAKELGLPLDFFEQPDKTQAREDFRQKVLAEFLASPLAEGVTEEERTSVASIRLPSNRLPTVHFYVGLIYLLRNQLDPSRFEEEVAENEALADTVRRKDQEPPRKPKPRKR